MCMLRFILVLLILINLPVIADNYNVYRNGSSPDIRENERVLFILDFSNSMSEYLDGKRKVDLMIDTMRNLLPKLNPNIYVGLRVYGHRMGFTPYELNSGIGISSALQSVKPRGMTPITYSLKQAIKNDFLGYVGKKHIILLTDGGENCDESPCKYVMELIKIRKDVMIDVIAFNVDDEDDLSQLECTSMVTSGKFYNAQTAAELANSLNNSVSAMKEVEAKIIGD